MAKFTSETSQQSFCGWLLSSTVSPAKQAFERQLFFTKRKMGLEYVRASGLGQRGFLDSSPEQTAENSEKYEAMGIHWWGHSFAVKKTIEEAREHDSKFTGLSKIMYLISDVDVSDLDDSTPKEIIQARFKEVVANGKMVGWDDSEAMITGNPIPAKFVEADMKRVRGMVLPEKVDYFTLDDRGARFTNSGWVFTKIRGELTYATLFESNSKTIRDLESKARNKARKGYTFTFNENFTEALNAARDQLRVVKNPVIGKPEKSPANSRYLIDPDTYNLALEGYKTGHFFSVETRKNGQLVGGIIGSRQGNLIKLDTIFYGYEDKPDGTFKSLVDDAKLAVIAAMKRLHAHKINVADVGMVTPFTASMKGKYVSGTTFLKHLKELKALGPVEIDFTTPWVPEPVEN